MNIHPIIDISIHAPREGCDYANDEGMAWPSVFQSTHPVRGATGNLHRPKRDAGISIHAPREGCDDVRVFVRAGAVVISIHAPREGCDSHSRSIIQSALHISIHAPREGCDPVNRNFLLPAYRFQSTHPVRGATAGMDFASQDTDTPTTP